MNTLKSSREKELASAAEPYRFTKRLGSTTYRVVVHFNPDTKESVSDKVARLVRNEAMGKVVNL